MFNAELAFFGGLVRGAVEFDAQAVVLGTVVSEGHHFDKVVIIFFGKGDGFFRQIDGVLVNVGKVIPDADGKPVHFLKIECSFYAFAFCHFFHG